MTASHQERRTTHFLKELGWRGNKNSMSSPTTFDKYTTQTSNGFSSYQPCEKRSFQLLSNTGQNIFGTTIQFFSKYKNESRKKLQKISYRETFHDHKADKISNLEYSHVSIFGIFHPFTSNFLIGIASKPTQQQKSHFEREEDF